MYNRRARSNDNRSYYFFAFLAGACTLIHTRCVCLFVSFSLSITPRLPLSPKQRHALSMTTNDNGVYVCVSNSFFWPIFFLASFIFFFSFFFFFFFYSSVSLHLRTRKIRTQKNRAIKKRISFNSEIAYMISLSFVLFFPFFTQIYNYNRKERLTLPQQLSNPMIYDRYRRRKAIDKIILIDYRQ
jgi:hypothetical protein